MRLFIAIELPKIMRSELSSALKELRSKSSGGRFVAEDNLHITLHFIGESEDLAGAVEAMHSACEGIRPFELYPEVYGSFGKEDSKVAYVSVGGQLNELNVLHEVLESALSDNGFSREYRKFVPHITLGRNVEADALVEEEMKALSFNTRMTVTGITLFESERRNGKLYYNPLHREKF